MPCTNPDYKPPPSGGGNWLAIMLEEFIIPFIVGVGFVIVGGFLLKENVDNKVDDIIENTEFYPDDYTVKCKVITIDNKSDTTYFLERKKHKKK